MGHKIIGGQLKLPDGTPLPLSKAIRAGDFVLCSGQLGIDCTTGGLAGDDIEAQTRQCFSNIRDVLRAAGCTIDQVVKATVWLVRREDFARFNAVYAEQFTTQPPVRSTVVCDLVLPGALVEIEVLAYAP